jgi:hypothetical protein
MQGPVRFLLSQDAFTNRKEVMPMTLEALFWVPCLICAVCAFLFTIPVIVTTIIHRWYPQQPWRGQVWAGLLWLATAFWAVPPLLYHLLFT